MVLCHIIQKKVPRWWGDFLGMRLGNVVVVVMKSVILRKEKMTVKTRTLIGFTNVVVGILVLTNDVSLLQV